MRKTFATIGKKSKEEKNFKNSLRSFFLVVQSFKFLHVEKSKELEEKSCKTCNREFHSLNNPKMRCACCEKSLCVKCLPYQLPSKIGEREEKMCENCWQEQRKKNLATDKLGRPREESGRIIKEKLVPVQGEYHLELKPEREAQSDLSSF